MQQLFSQFCRQISYQFRDKKLLDEAMTHPSLYKDVSDKPNYQRLEFLGDKVLSLVIGDFLMKKFPSEMEGDLSKRQAALVSGETLAEIASEVGIEKVLQVSRGEKNLGGQTNKRNLENALEALIGAIYLDANYDEAKKFIMKFWHNFLEKDITPPQDAVSALQELVQLQSKQLPQYDTIKSGGFDHAPSFVSTVRINYLNREFSAAGRSKKEAQKEAARVALDFILQRQTAL